MGRAVALTVGPLVSASATAIGTSQKSTGTYLVLNGSTGVASATGVCASQTPGGAGALTLNGTLAHSNGYVIPSPGGLPGTIVASGTAAAYLPYPQRIYITGGSNESGKTFTVVGYVFPLDGVGGPVAVTETITGPNASTVSSANLYSIIVSITVSTGTAGAITVGNYGTATLDTGRRVIVTSAGNDSAITFAISGTDVTGNPISETLTGANATAAQSALDYATITSIKPSAAVASTVTIGTNGVASRWVRLDDYASAAQVAIQATVSGTANYTIQQTLDDPAWLFSGITPATMTWVNHPDSGVVAASATAQANYAYPPLFARVVLNSGSGSVTATFRQTGLW